MQWYYTKGGQQFGPVEEAELFSLAKTRELLPEDLVWNSTMGNEWVKASTIATLFDGIVQPPPAPVSANPPPPPWQEMESASFVPGQTHNRDLMRMARESLANCWGIAIAIVVIYWLINACVQAVPYIGGLASLIIAGPLAVGFNLTFLLIARRSTAQIERLFDGFKIFGTALGAYLLMVLFILLWSLLLIIPGIIAAYSYAMTFFILADDPAIGPLDAITRSKEMMRGHKWKLFCLGWRFFGWLLLAILTCCIGFLWLAPYVQTSLAHFYEDVRPRKR
jgi:uncharacterized membrane protein